MVAAREDLTAEAPGHVRQIRTLQPATRDQCSKRVVVVVVCVPIPDVDDDDVRRGRSDVLVVVRRPVLWNCATIEIQVKHKPAQQVRRVELNVRAAQRSLEGPDV